MNGYLIYNTSMTLVEDHSTLLSRIVNSDPKPCRKNEIIEYLESVNKLTGATVDHSIYEKIPDNISISYRFLVNVLRLNSLDLEKTVDYLSIHHPTKISSSM
jgi:hypothetical protein